MLHENRRKEERRLRELENVFIAKKLMTVRGSKHLSKNIMDNNFDKHLRAKAILCKLPIIDMANNSHSPKNKKGH